MVRQPSVDEKRYVLRPLTNPNGKRGPRLEIDEFAEDVAMLNLFLLALRAMHARSLDARVLEGVSEPDWLKHYALASIHGEPREDWNGWPNNRTENPEGDGYGYCQVTARRWEVFQLFLCSLGNSHGRTTFPTWHRPYIMLYETAVHDNMVTIANTYQEPHKTKYLEAAARFRLPYLDPIMPRNPYDPASRLDTVWGIPKFLNERYVWVREAEDPTKLTRRDNPLFSFSFPRTEEWKENQASAVRRKHFPYNIEKSERPGEGKYKVEGSIDLKFQRQGANLATKLWRMLSPDFVAYDKQGKPVKLNEVRSWDTFADHSTETPQLINDEGDLVKRDQAGKPLEQGQKGFSRSGFRLNKEAAGKGIVAPTFDTNKQRDEFLENIATVSLESWHDGVHGMIGGLMGNPNVAAFDPIFWLHHNNIDRILSLHQAMYGQKMNQNIAKRPLVPFTRDVKGTMYTSSDPLVTSYWASGFAVPGEKESDPATIKDLIRQYLSQTYAWATNYSLPEKKVMKEWKKDQQILPNWPKDHSKHEALTGKEMPQEVFSRSTDFTAIVPSAKMPELVLRRVAVDIEDKISGPSDVPVKLESTLKAVAAIENATPDNLSNGRTLSWNAHIRVRKFAFDGSFSIHIFIGNVRDDQTERFYTVKNEVGFSFVFASDSTSACASCADNRAKDLIFQDVVPLTPQLWDYLSNNPKSRDLITDGDYRNIASVKPEDVEPFLKEHLHWRMVDAQGNLLTGREQEAGLEVAIASSDFKSPDEHDIMGKYETPVVYPGITSEKPGGLGYNYPAA